MQFPLSLIEARKPSSPRRAWYASEQYWAGSTGRRNTFSLTGLQALVQSFGGSSPSEGLEGPCIPGHWFAKMLDGGAGYAQCHAARPDDPPFQRATWRRANPSLDHMPDLEAAIRDEAKLARIDPAMLAAFRALRLNLGTSDVEVQVLIDAALWASCERVATRPGPMVWGIDLGTSQAQSAIAAFWPQTGALSCLAAFPEQPSLEERGLRDGCGRLYRDCADRGELLTLGQRATDVGALMRAGMERFGRPDLVVADRWREAELRDALEAAGVPRPRWMCVAWATATVPKMSDNSAAHALKGGSRRHPACYSAAPWPKPAPCPTQPEIKNSARARKAGAE